MKVIDQLLTLRTGYQAAEHKLTKYFYLENDVPVREVYHKNPVYETTAILKMRQVGSGQKVDKNEERLINEHAAKAISRELYGDVVDRLYEIAETLYEDGPKYDDKVLEMVIKLVDELQLKDKFK